MTAQETRIIAAALPFVNNIPHLGNLAGSHLPADIFARYCRLVGHRAVFVGGTDEHGTATEFAAFKARVEPAALCDRLYGIHKDLYDWFQISYDNFSRTSRSLHHAEVKKFFESLHAQGYILSDDIESAFCEDCQRALADRLLVGKCPDCGHAEASGDQCENCSAALEVSSLSDLRCRFCGSPSVTLRCRPHLVLDLRPVAARIEEWLRTTSRLRPQVRSEALGWLSQGLKPRCITRDLKWGVQVPLDRFGDKVFYIWFENLIGYISAIVELLGEPGRAAWRDERVKKYFFHGKDNIVFHSIYWPGALLAEGSIAQS